MRVSDSAFLHELHARFGAPRDRIISCVEHETGRFVEALERVVNGYDNEVYRVGLAGAETVYLRIRRFGEGDFDGEVWAMVRARQAGVPVPEVVSVDRMLTDDGERSVMIVRTAAGRALETMSSPDDRRAALVDLGRTLRQLHAIPTPGMWRPDGNGRWLSVDALRAGFVRDRQGEREHLVRAGLGGAEIEQTYRVLEEFPGRLPVVPVLCHGDLNRGHIFVDDDRRVSCLIDWGMWHGGSVEGEFAGLWKTVGLDGLEHVLRGHGEQTTTDTVFRGTIAKALVQQQIGHIAHHAMIGDSHGVRRNVGFLRQGLAELT